MRICFFGHSDFISSPEIKDELLSILKNYTDKEDCEFLFGGYGFFDDFSYRCVKEISSKNKIIKSFVTPYITESYCKNHLEYKKDRYDYIIYPEIETVPYRFAITARNKWMVNTSDVVITYVTRRFGGAYAAYKYALGKKKELINLGKI